MPRPSLSVLSVDYVTSLECMSKRFETWNIRLRNLSDTNPPQKKQSIQRQLKFFFRGLFLIWSSDWFFCQRIANFFFVHCRDFHHETFSENARWTLTASWNGCKMSWANSATPKFYSRCTHPYEMGPLRVINEVIILLISRNGPIL